ncbi:uncharacterized protein LOC143000936 isoform X2 [Genypterus blacodes]|uniref:uncharacterized protein LOC143000936 isoform X2 n=1 Tax=Genypterus blacodes TaxID=154954 RepID=UPI003F75A023
MNLVHNRTLHPHLRDDEALVVENAIRLAIDSIINVLYGVNSGRTREYERMVADRDKEIQRMERRLREIEDELRLIRRQGCSCGLMGSDLSLGSAQSCVEQHRAEQSSVESSSGAAAGQECEMSFSFGLFARPPSQVSSQSHESALPSSPSRLGLDQTCASHSSEASGASEAVRNLPSSPGGLVVKEEPCDVDTVMIKWEMNEERCSERQENSGGPCQEEESPSVKRNMENRETTSMEKPEAEPDGLCATEGVNERLRKRGVPLSEEEAMRQKRAAWRAASRRYYARKVARQQGNPQRSARVTNTQYLQRVSPYVDKRKAMLGSDFPQESQVLQREAWRAASRRYCAEKSPLLQAEGSQYNNFTQNTETHSGDAQGPNRGGPQTNNGGLGGILCS